jgi:hypothetical protein
MVVNIAGEVLSVMRSKKLLHSPESGTIDPTRRLEGRQVLDGQLADPVNAEFLQ